LAECKKHVATITETVLNSESERKDALYLAKISHFDVDEALEYTELAGVLRAETNEFRERIE
jgi:hypothetical protein